MRILKQGICLLSAAVLGICSCSVFADADALDPGHWYIKKYMQVNHSGVYGYSSDYVMNGGSQEIVRSFQPGDVVYVKYGYSSLGVNWGLCYDSNTFEANAVYYGWVDLAYLSEVGAAVADPEPETEKVIVTVTEVVTVIETVPVTEPTTIPETEPAVTTEKTTISSSSTITSSTENTTTTTTVQALSTEDTDSTAKNSWISDNLPILIIGGVVFLLGISAGLVIATVQHQKKQSFIPSEPTESAQVEGLTQICPQCGAQLDENASFCKNCGMKIQ